MEKRRWVGAGMRIDRSIGRRIGTAVLDVLLPHRCLRCGTAVDAAGVLCPDCWSELSFLGEPCCACCGLPFGYFVGEGALCAGCIRNRPLFDRARAALRYDDGSRPMILALKHRDRTETAPVLARWMVRTAGELIAEADCIVPVPLHWTRLFARRFNQSALLAQAIARIGDKRFEPMALRRARRTPSQGRLGRSARLRNVRGAFSVPPGMVLRIRDKRVLLVDDVMTTGATVSACARALRTRGAAAVDVLTLARVV